MLSRAQVLLAPRTAQDRTALPLRLPSADFALLCPQVTDVQLLVRAWELHTLEVTGLEAFAHIKAKTHVASLEGHTTEDKVVLLAGSPLPGEAILGQRGVEALATLEMVGRMLGGD